MAGIARIALLLALAVPAPAAAQVPVPLAPEPDPAPPPEQEEQPPAQERSEPAPSYARLSDEKTLSRWAHAVTRTKVRRNPSSGSRSITRLRYDTEDGLPEVYLALRRYIDADGRRWVEVRLPMRPNGKTGWVPRQALGDFHRVRTFLRIDRRRLRATLYRGGKRIWSQPVGIGKAGTETPAGRFYVRERLRVREPGSIYGPLAFGTSAYSKLSDWPGGGVIGIHGTNQPELIPGRPSHGCIRVRNRAIKRLGRLMPIGTPIRIR
jgi:hypothetical protein